MEKSISLKKIAILAFSMLCLCCFMFVGCGEKEQNVELKQLESSVTDVMNQIDDILWMLNTTTPEEFEGYKKVSYFVFSKEIDVRTSMKPGGGYSGELHDLYYHFDHINGSETFVYNTQGPTSNDALTYDKLNDYKEQLKHSKFIYYNGCLFDLSGSTFIKVGSNNYDQKSLYFFREYRDYLAGNYLSKVSKMTDGSYAIYNYVHTYYYGLSSYNDAFNILYTKIDVVNSLPA